MRNIYRIINIAVVFMIVISISVALGGGIAYSSDISHLRVPVGLDKNRVIAIKEHFDNRGDASPHRLTINECRKRLLENLRDLKALYPFLQKEFAYGLETLQSEGVDAFEKKAYPRIKEASDKIKVKVSAIRTLPTVFGFSEPEIRERLDTFLQQISEEAKADKVLIWFDYEWQYDFTYTRGFSEQDLMTFSRNREDIGRVIARERSSDPKDEKEQEKDKALLKDCGIVTALEASPDLQKWHNEATQDNYIRIVIGRSEEYVKTYGELTEQDRTLLTNRLNALIDAKSAPWWGIRDYLNTNEYSDFDTFMMILRHNGSVDIFNVSIFPFIYNRIQYYIDRIKANDNESQKWLDVFARNIGYFAREKRVIKEMETFLSLLETGTDFRIRNITKSLNKRILSFTKEAKAKGLEYIVDLTGEDLFAEHCDLNLLDIIINNLIQNAIKYTPKGKVSVCVLKKPVDYKYSVRKQFLSAVIEIEDTGIGIPEEEQGKIFNRGYRATNVGDIYGRGIGLDVTSVSVQTMHGELQLESKIGEGTKITVYLPLLQQESPLKEKIDSIAPSTDL